MRTKCLTKNPTASRNKKSRQDAGVSKKGWSAGEQLAGTPLALKQHSKNHKPGIHCEDSGKTADREFIFNFRKAL